MVEVVLSGRRGWNLMASNEWQRDDMRYHRIGVVRFLLAAAILIITIVIVIIVAILYIIQIIIIVIVIIIIGVFRFVIVRVRVFHAGKKFAVCTALLGSAIPFDINDQISSVCEGRPQR